MTINIEHLAIWTENLEKVKDFYIKYFDMQCSEKYYNPTKQFTSYFLSFKNSNVRIELMHRPGILQHIGEKGITNGLAHFTISVGSKEAVDILTVRLGTDNGIIQSEPRTTADDYYESVVLDLKAT